MWKSSISFHLSCSRIVFLPLLLHVISLRFDISYFDFNQETFLVLLTVWRSTRLLLSSFR